MNNKGFGVLLLLVGMTLFGSATPISKLVGEGFPVFTASTFRVILGALSLFPLIAKDFKSNFQKLDKKAWGELALISLFGMVGFTVFLIYGMKYITGVAGSIIMSTTPAITALAAFLFMGSPLDWRRVLAIIFGVCGIILINVFRQEFNDADTPYFYLGVILVFLAISCEATYTLMGKKATESLNPLFASFMSCVMSIPLFLLLAWIIDFHKFDLESVSATSWYALLWWGVGTLGAGSAIWYSGLARAEGTTAAGFMSIMALSALVLSYVLLGESFELIHIPGIVLVLASIGLMSWVHMTSHHEGH
jgi:drug/metabolite transporter (DMT)-like permease